MTVIKIDNIIKVWKKYLIVKKIWNRKIRYNKFSTHIFHVLNSLTKLNLDQNSNNNDYDKFCFKFSFKKICFKSTNFL